ncbi:MAG: amidohydrolase [Candidatus Bathyarchaeota archaeon B23]|nr:MAG: amidohydrolase [Candidatus Bathyarchaeota archaeon B23]
MKEVAWNWIEENRGEIIRISDTIWRYAEIGLQEYRSSRLLADILERHGFEVEVGVAGMPTAFVATWGELIGIMGEYDALPGLSQKPLPHREPLEEGAPGHGCGHNIHGASGMAGAIALKVAMEERGMGGTVRFFGCPAEESLSGKVWMVREGIFKGVDVVLSHHPGSMNVASLSGSLANNSVRFHFYGRSSHAAGSPEQGRSALDAVELMNIGVNYLREHITEKARIHYVIEAGGRQPNIVPDYARSWYLIRAPERDQLETIYRRVLKIAEGASLMTETRVEVEFIKGVYNKITNRVLSEVVTSNMREIGAPEYSEEDMEFARAIAETIPPEEKREALRKTERPGWEELMDVFVDRSIPDPWDEGKPGRGSTDVADVSWQAPTMEFSTAAFVLGTPGHSWQVVAQSASGLGHQSLIFASKVIAGAALDLIAKRILIERAWEEFQGRIRGRTYRSPIPGEMKPPLDFWSRG